MAVPVALRAGGAELMAPMRLKDEARTSGECSGEEYRVRPLRHECKSRRSQEKRKRDASHHDSLQLAHHSTPTADHPRNRKAARRSERPVVS